MTVEVIKAEAAACQQEATMKVVEVVEVADDLKKEINEDDKPKAAVEKSSSFKEESNFFSDLKEHEKKALTQLKSKLEEAILGNSLFKKDEPKVEEKRKVEVEVKEVVKEVEEKECAPVKEEVEKVEEPKEEGDEKEKEVEKEKCQEGEEEKKPVEKKGLNELRLKLKEAFKGHSLFRKKSPKNEKPKVEEKECEAVEEPAKEEGKKKEEGEKKEEKKGDEKEEKEVQDCEEEKKPEAVVEEKPEAVVEEKDVEVIKTEDCVEEKKIEEECVEEVVVDTDISIWGVPLLPSKADERTDVVLLKFLRARDFKVSEAFEMLKKTLEWRKEWKIDSILDEDLGNDLAPAAYMSGVDREGHPICYNIFGVLDNEELFQKTFGSEEKRDFFLRWRFQLMEKGIQKLELKPAGVSSLLQVNDLKNTPGPAKKEVRAAINQAVALLQDNYPEFVARNIFINVPFWYYAYHALLSPFLTQRTKSKFVVARPAKVTETLLKYIPIEEIPTQYGGLKRDSDFEFSTEDGAASELVIKAASTAIIEIPAPQAGTTFIWDMTVLGWDVNYKEEFVPSDECSYTIIVQKQKKLCASEGPVRNTFRTNEPGKIVLTVENSSNKKKKILYRHKVKKCAF